MIGALVLPADLRAQLAAEAEAAFPKECCGLIEGVPEGEGQRVTALHPTKNLAAAPDRFDIDPAEHIRLLRGLRGTGREIIGCYHSHPGGAAEPSARDLAAAADEGFVWLIAAIPGEIAAFVFENGAFQALALKTGPLA